MIGMTLDLQYSHTQVIQPYSLFRQQLQNKANLQIHAISSSEQQKQGEPILAIVDLFLNLLYETERSEYTISQILKSTIQLNLQGQYRVLAILQNCLIEIDDQNTTISDLMKNKIREVAVCQQIKVLIQKPGMIQQTSSYQHYHKELKLSQLLQLIDISDDNCIIKIDGSLFNGDKQKKFEELKILPHMVISVNQYNFKSIVYLINALGFWDNKIFSCIEQSQTDWFAKQKLSIKQVNRDYIATTLLGLKLLKTKFNADYNQWRMIERKAIAYLESTDLNKNADIKDLLNQIQL